MTHKTGDKNRARALACAASFSAFAIPTFAHAAAVGTVPEVEPNSFQIDEDLIRELNAVSALEQEPAARASLHDFTLSDLQDDKGTPPAAGAKQSDPERLEPIEQQLADMAAELKSQREQISAQNALILKQQMALDALLQNRGVDADLAMIRGTGAEQGLLQSAPLLPDAAEAQSNAPLPDGPVGQAPPPEPSVEAQVQALPEGQGVLTPAGTIGVESSFEYTNESANRLVFRGFELIPGIQIGLIEASNANRDTVSTAMSLRYGVTNRLELQARIPALFRWDTFQVAQQRDESIVREIKLKQRSIGDIEFGARYQLNRPKGQNPIWVANLLVKSDTGIGPFDIGYDEFGVATGLATGSGFWGVQPGINFLLPSDPAVIFGSLSYLYHIGKNVNRNVGGAFVGRVDPGDAINGNLGFGFALNPRFSFSLGYKHSFILPSVTEIGGTTQRSKRAQVGSFTMGMSYRLSERQSVNVSFDLGATSDAPDLGVTLRIPFSINTRRRR
jgi:hypothetical protein